MNEITVIQNDQYGIPRRVSFTGRAAAWLCFLRWLHQTGRITDELPELAPATT